MWHRPDCLTSRELEVLELMALGDSDKEIANVLAIARSTASNHVCQILQKLGARNRTQAVIIAVRRDLLSIVSLAEDGRVAADR